MKQPEHILIVKLSAIGDVIHTLPFLAVLRRRFPHATIDWLIEEESSRIIDGHPDIDRIIISRRKSWQRRVFRFDGTGAVLPEIYRFLKALRAREYDLVIDLQGLLKSGLLTGISRGKRKIGPAGGREGSRFFLTEPPHDVNYHQHAVDRYLEMAEVICRPADLRRFHIPVQDRDRRAVDRLIRKNRIPVDRMVTVNPMARWRTKLWDTAKFAELADRLVKDLSLSVVFTGSRRDRDTITRITDLMNEKAHNLAGRTDLKELAFLYSRSRFLITTDTGPMHIAAAVKCPVIALFGPTDPGRTGPYGEGHRVIRETMDCSPCFKKHCDHLSCMKQITVARVFEAARELVRSRG
jgi:3-deoxy-D-manno-octulosonic-acid transferase/heptosyltransferase-1